MGVNFRREQAVALLRGIWLMLAIIASTRPLAAQTADEAIRQTLPKVVKIYGAGGLRGLAAYSTGFLVSPEGHIATVWSHVLDRDEVTVVGGVPPVTTTV